MKECDCTSSPVQGLGELFAETPVSVDGTSRLLRLAPLAEELSSEPSPRKHVNSQGAFLKAVST